MSGAMVKSFKRLFLASADARLSWCDPTSCEVPGVAVLHIGYDNLHLVTALSRDCHIIALGVNEEGVIEVG